MRADARLAASTTAADAPHPAPARVCACILVTGTPAYFHAARAAVRSLLRHTDFDVLVALGDRADWRPSRSPRVVVRSLAAAPRGRHRAWPFLLKFRALEACLAASPAERILLLDADTRLVRRTTRADVEHALAGRQLAMAEQTTIRGSGMTRADFLEHYVRHPLAWLGDGTPAPALADFRFFNSGVLLARRDGLEPLLAWALERMRAAGDAHQAGAHMIADQDYLQLWTNGLHPGSCATLSWEWNHCEHWDEGFPRPGARILHASNFCRGPSRLGLLRLEARLALARLRRVVSGAAAPFGDLA